MRDVHSLKKPILLSVLMMPGLVAGAAAFVPPSAVVHLAERVTPAVVFSADVDEPVVALTIDDGPSARTGDILAVLAEHEARATFFVIGENVERHAATALRIRARGHELAHHMTAAEPTIRLDATEFRARFDRMHRMLVDLGGVPLFRPGSGWYDERMVEAVARSGYRLVLGSVYPFDAQIPIPSFLSWYVLRNTRPGSIIVLHDGNGRGPRTAEVLRRILPELKRRGYRIVTVTELLRSAG